LPLEAAIRGNPAANPKSSWRCSVRCWDHRRRSDRLQLRIAFSQPAFLLNVSKMFGAQGFVS
jgi:hypothetical protein